MFDEGKMNLLLEESFRDMGDIIISREKTPSDRIMTNLSRAGSSCEHWFEFELLSQVNNHLDNPDIICESERSMRRPGSRFDLCVTDHGKVLLAIELKVIGNWYTPKPHLRNMTSDIVKLEENLETPKKTAVIITIFAVPVQGRLPWMEDLFRIKKGTLSEEDFAEKIHAQILDHTERKWFDLPKIHLPSNEFFTTLSVGGVAFKVF